MHVKVRRGDQLVGKSYSLDVELGQNSVPVSLVLNRGKNMNTKNKLNCINEAMGEQRTFTSSADHTAIYPQIATEAAKSNSHTSGGNENSVGVDRRPSHRYSLL